VLTRTIIGLVPKLAGRIEVFGSTSTPPTPLNGAASNGAGASCSSRVRCFPR